MYTCITLKHPAHDSWLKTPGSRAPAHGSRAPAHNPWFTTPDSRPPAQGSGAPAHDSGAPAHNSRLTTPGSRPSAHDPQLITHGTRALAHDPLLTTPCSRPPSHEPRLTSPCSRAPAHEPLGKDGRTVASETPQVKKKQPPCFTGVLTSEGKTSCLQRKKGTESGKSVPQKVQKIGHSTPVIPSQESENVEKRSDPICHISVNSELQLVKRLRGGARGGGTTLQDLAVRLATRIGFCIKPGQPNPATGNCLIESAVFNINDRAELALFGQITDTILECRTLWVTQFQTQIPVFAPELDAFTEEQWDKIKHRKNCECCHHHSVFKGHNVIVHIVVLNCQKCNQCLKCQVSGHKNFQKI